MINSILRQTSNFILARKLPNYQRFLLKKMDFSDRLIGIRGARGSGKTTIMLQYAQSTAWPASKMLYLSCDHPAMVDEDLFEIAQTFYQEGGKLLILDEIQKAKNFSLTLKAIYDTFDLQVIFSGSSAIQISQMSADLSRRAVLFHLPVLSLREFIEIETGLKIAPVSLDQLLNQHQDLAFNLSKQLRPIEYFRRYCQTGAYPFYQESISNYPLKLLETINHTIDADLPAIFNLDPTKLDKLKKILYMLCTTPPVELNKAKLSGAVHTSWPTLAKYIALMQSADLLHSIRGGAGMRAVNRPDKLLLNNPNLFSVLCANPNIGSLRESFFVSQLSLEHQVHYHDQGDFLIDDQRVFEIGGASKTKQQIKHNKQAWLAVDDMEVGHGNTVPLWLFGLLY
ncbi:ATP-binding protein [Thiomicrospira cyclica]|uniref:AAA ATPase n=1 Tax=Thiomicrospira cyclica (strain DSM 14477 / JCM 11371 / ALM1) TaxID=717773 RepID=F6DAJ9_THICA|nr:AAA family ATPase [Thiomicrospira cyclica]AEG32255.1 AAA ATPase [Thiomicrospira cyclica ALM1]